MKILQLVQQPQRRGAEVFAQQLNQELKRGGHQVRTAYLYPYAGAHALPLGDEDSMLGGREDHPFEKVPGIHPGLLRRLRRVVDETEPDVVQVNGGRTVKYGAALALAVRQRRWVLVYRNIGQLRDWVRGAHQAVYSRLIMPRMDGVIAVSHATMQSLSEMYHLSVPMAHIPCAVDLGALAVGLTREAVRRRHDTPLDAPVVVWVGTLSREKRVDRLLRATVTARRRVPDLHLWIVGGGPLRNQLEAEVRASELASYVRFLGVQEHVADCMSAGDILALTSDTEGMPAVLLEAGLLGLPVVATRVGGVSECVRHGETGILVRCDDREGLANALRDLLEQPDRRSRFGAAARAWIERNFTMTRIAPQYAAFYQRVLAR
jgi:glycosyltransferase involved in cell wall biosynthesis